MQKLEFTNKKILVMGLGLNGGGVGSAKFFARCGARVTVTDIKTRQQLASSLKQLAQYRIRYVLGKHQEKDFETADLVIQNPAVPDDSRFLNIARKHNVPIATDIAIFFQYCTAPILGVTGTKGKTTTAGLIGQMLKAWDKKTVVAGNLRVSPLDFLPKLLAIKHRQPWVVLELSSFQLEGLQKIQRSPKIAVVTNIYEDHLNRYISMKKYMKAKQSIVAFQKNDDAMILNADNAHARAFAKISPATLQWFSIKKLQASSIGVWVENGWIVYRATKQQARPKAIIAASDLPWSASHLLSDTCAAIATVITAGVPLNQIVVCLQKARLPEARMQTIATVKGVRCINDTTATIPSATIATLQSFGKDTHIILIAGGVDKSVSYTTLVAQIQKKCKAVVLLHTGKRETASVLIKTLLSKKNYAPIESADTMEDAVIKAFGYASYGDVILLSPSAASFGMFEHEFDRGEQFERAVKNIKKQ